MTALSDDDLFAALTQVKVFTPMLAQALADHISTKAKERDALQARLAEALKTLDAIDEEGDDHYYDIADAARMILRGIVTHGDCSEPTVNRTADSADAAPEVNP